jgi:plastocyanin
MGPLKDIEAHKTFDDLAVAHAWDWGFLGHKGDRFAVTLTVEGVYDYYCMPHEAAGMVGRLVVGTPGGPGALPFDYFVDRPGAEAWRLVASAAQKTFPSIERIMLHQIARRG